MMMEGSNLVMLSEMSTAPGFDTSMGQHGRSMIQKGKDLLKRALEGSEMKGLHPMGEKEEAMTNTHSLGQAMLAVADLLDPMRLTEPKKDEMTLHHMHTALNHALDMAAQGSNLIMLGQMGMAGTVDTATVDHGKAMISEARAMWKETMDGKAMQELMKGGQSAEMQKTHELAAAGQKVLDLLARMAEIGALRPEPDLLYRLYPRRHGYQEKGLRNFSRKPRFIGWGTRIRT
jgi:hypothetical protein